MHLFSLYVLLPYFRPRDGTLDNHCFQILKYLRAYECAYSRAYSCSFFIFRLYCPAMISDVGSCNKYIYNWYINKSLDGTGFLGKRNVNLLSFPGSKSEEIKLCY